MRLCLSLVARTSSLGRLLERGHVRGESPAKRCQRTETSRVQSPRCELMIDCARPERPKQLARLICPLCAAKLSRCGEHLSSRPATGWSVAGRSLVVVANCRLAAYCEANQIEAHLPEGLFTASNPCFSLTTPTVGFDSSNLASDHSNRLVPQTQCAR